MNTRQIIVVMLGMGIVVMSMPACEEDSQKEEEETPVLNFLWIPKELKNDVFETGRDGARKKARELSDFVGDYDINIIYAGTESAADVEGQAALVREALDLGVDGVAVSCNTPDGLKDAINEVVAAGVPVMTFDSDSPDSERFTYLGVDNREGGALAAKILGISMADITSTQVALVSGVEGAANLDARIAGFETKLAEDYPDLEIIDTVYCDDDATESAALIEGLLADNPDLGGLFFVGLWPLFNCEDADCSEMMPLWDAAAKSGEVKTVVFDTLEFQLDFVQNGMVAGLIGQKYWGWGYDAVGILYDRVMDNKIFGDWTDSGIDVVCPNNVDEMMSMWQEVDFTQLLTPCKIDGITVD